MNANSLMPKNLLSAADVHDAKGKAIYRAATIAGLSQIEVGPEKDLKWALSFGGTDRKLTLNATNRDRLVELFGAETDDWTGKAIALVGSTAQFQGKTVKAIRIDEPVAGASPIAEDEVPA